ncbi:MAG: putative lipoate-protein ligase [Verrucomicrobiota bacterium]|jgi:lipoate-protein ligase A
MLTLDFPILSPADLLAAEEVLLEAAESGQIGESLSFWESREHFVVLGYGNKAATETDPSACQRFNIPILRRISGGGTVLQGPGVLNYSLVLRAEEGSPLARINGSNQFIMQRNAEALTQLLGGNKRVEVQGHTDLVIDGRKFSGNAQRRKRTHLLFHGSILVNLDLALLDRVLPMPSLEPEYRQHRTHRDFLTQLPFPASDVKKALRTAWSATVASSLDALINHWRDAVAQLAAEKYSQPDWNLRV